MDPGLKQRLIGAAVLVALAVIFLPMLVQGPAPDSGVSNVPLTMPDPPRGDYETRDLPLVSPGEAPSGGAVGMASTPAATTNAPEMPPTVASTTPAPASAAVPMAAASTPTPTPLPAEVPLPAAMAGGDYAVSFGAYAGTDAADRMIAALRAARLPGYREATTSGGKPAWRVRIGPYATRAEAEAARLRAALVRGDVGASVVALDAVQPPKPAGTAAVATVTPAVSKSIDKPVGSQKPAVPAATKPTIASAAGTGFAVQLAAFAKAADATALRDRLRAAGFSAFTENVTTDKGALTRVRVGPVVSRAEADALQAQVRARLGVDGIVRPHP